jgi:peptide/nickel transport system substrate-binding protein
MDFKSQLPLLFITIYLASCNSVSHNNGKQVFNYNESNGISSLDPAFSRDLESMWACNQLFDGLLSLDSSLNIIPCIASSYEIDSAGTAYTFYLRNDVVFHDNACFEGGKGRKVIASDFIFSFNRLLDDATASPGRWVFDKIRTLNPFEAPNDSTLIIHLSAPFPAFPGLLTTQYCNVIPKEAIDAYGADFRSNPVGTGPFQFAFWMEEVALVFHKNPHYWEKDEFGNGLPYLDAVKIDFVRDMNAEYLGLLKGEYDFMSGIHQSYKDELLDANGNLSESFHDKIRLQRVPFIKTDYLGILVDDSLPISATSPLMNKKVRQALNFALDRKKMVRFLRNNSVYAAEAGFVPPGLPGFGPTASYGYSYQPEKSARLLAESGFPQGKGLGSITLATTSDYVDLCEFVQHEWQKIGVNVSIDVLPGGTHREVVAKSQVLMFRKSWLADYADAGNFLGLFHSSAFSPDGPNYTHYQSEDFDNLFDQASAQTDDSLRFIQYKQLDSLVMESAVIIPLYYDQVSHFVRKEISGFETNPVNMLDLRKVKKAS